MKYKKGVLTIVLFFVAIFFFWYYNFPFYEKKADERANAYIKEQKADSESVLKKGSFMNKQGRWEVMYKFKDEPDIIYTYTYDRSSDRMLLMVFHNPNSLHMQGGISIERGMDYPKLKYDDQHWIEFDNEGNPIIDE